MFNPTEILIDGFVSQLDRTYHQTFGGYKGSYAEIIVWAGRMALENIANSDALYHDVEHTMLVTVVGQELLRGKHMSEGGVSSEAWLHFTISLLCHDIGYIRGVCRKDCRAEGIYSTGQGDEMVQVSAGASDASLTPYHVDRGKLFIEERFGGHSLIRVDLLKANIEETRFPVPEGSRDECCDTYPALLRAADLIGQLGDPRYLQKLHRLYHEFQEIGTNQKLGYTNPEELRRGYPSFYWTSVAPFIQDAVRYLDVTQVGKQILANLYANVFRSEHESSRQGAKTADALSQATGRPTAAEL